MFFRKQKFDVRQLKMNKFISNIKQLKTNKFKFDAKEWKMKKFMKSILQFIIGTSTLEDYFNEVFGPVDDDGVAMHSAQQWIKYLRFRCADHRSYWLGMSEFIQLYRFTVLWSFRLRTLHPSTFCRDYHHVVCLLDFLVSLPAAIYELCSAGIWRHLFTSVIWHH